MSRALYPLPVALLTSALFGCSVPVFPSPTPLDVDVQLRFKGSCGQILQYDTDCLAALQVVVFQGADQVHEACVELDNDERPDDLAGIFQLPPLTLGSRSDLGEIVLEVHGIHDAGNLAGSAPGEVCEDNRELNWLFWGESLPTDLNALAAAGDSATIEVRLDCRDCDNGCATIPDACPAVLPESYCVPFQVGFNCARRCDNDAECFEGSLLCADDDGVSRCDPTRSPDGNTGGFCFTCQSSLDCDVDNGFTCVGPVGGSQGVCSRACPFDRCVNGSFCQPLGSELEIYGG